MAFSPSTLPPYSVDTSSFPDAANEPPYDDEIKPNSCGPDDDDICRQWYNRLKKSNADIEYKNIRYPGQGWVVALMHQWNETAIQYNLSCVPRGHPEFSKLWFFIFITPKG